MTKKLARAIEADRADRPPRGSLAWCSEHDCRPSTCFELHWPNAYKRARRRTARAKAKK